MRRLFEAGAYSGAGLYGSLFQALSSWRRAKNASKRGFALPQLPRAWNKLLPRVNKCRYSYVIIFFLICLEESSCFCFCRLFLVSFNSRSFTLKCSFNLVCRLSDVPRAPSVDFRSSSWRSMLKNGNKNRVVDRYFRFLEDGSQVNYTPYIALPKGEYKISFSFP